MPKIGAQPLEVVVVTGEEGADLVKQFHSKYIQPTFASNEVEDVALWIERLEDASKRRKSGEDGPAPSFEFVVAVAISNEGGIRSVVGGASCELYRGCDCGLVTYVVVDVDLRGQGVARKLFDACYTACVDIANHFNGMFIEVLQKRDTSEEAKVAAANTNKAAIFSSLGFLPLDGDLVHPGRMRGHRYTLGFYSKSLAISTTSNNASIASDANALLSVPWEVVRAFATDMFLGILADEDKTGLDADKEVDTLLLAYQRCPTRTHIVAHPKFWL